MIGELSKGSGAVDFEPAYSFFFGGLERKEMCYSAVNPSNKKEADRLVQQHEAGPKPSTFLGKDDDYG